MSKIIIIDDLGQQLSETQVLSDELVRLGHEVINITRDLTTNIPMRARYTDMHGRICAYLDTLAPSEQADTYICAYGSTGLPAISIFAKYKDRVTDVILINPVCIDASKCENIADHWMSYYSQFGSLMQLSSLEVQRRWSTMRTFNFYVDKPVVSSLLPAVFCIIPNNELSKRVVPAFEGRHVVMVENSVEGEFAQAEAAAILHAHLNPSQ